MKIKKYNIGLDIGTNSVGWSVVDNNYNLLKYKKRNMWGVRLFDEGQTAEERRTFRGTRRRLKRRKERILLLQQLLSNDIEKVDKLFYTRLKQSFLHKEDRFDSDNKSNLFIDKKFSDKEFYKKYKTIYHLRKELIEDPSKKDIRLVYLAIHHIIKYRGNFLYEGQDLSDIADDILKTINELIDICNKYEIANIDLDAKDIKAILIDKGKTKSKRVELLRNNSKLYKNQLTNIFNGILGLKMDLSKIFIDFSFDKDCSFRFSDDDIDEKLSQAENTLGDMYDIIIVMNKIYNWVILQSVLDCGSDEEGSSKYISVAKVKGYEIFKKQLSDLKTIIANYDKNEYDKLFKNKDFDVNYQSYINNKDKSKGANKSIKDLFYQKIQKIIEDNLDDDFMKNEKIEILHLIKNDNFLIIQRIKDNAGIPYQLNEKELKIILNNQSKYYDSIRENKDKIIRLLNFRIPYYIGPLNKNSSFSWLEKKENTNGEKIYPWNIDKVVDCDLSAEKFIKRMTNKCSYLIKEDVLPRNSIIFSEYMYYNEINKIKINNKKLSCQLKEDLKEKVFFAKKTVKEKDIIDWYKNYHQIDSNDVKVEGLQGDKQAASSFNAYIDFKGVFGKIDESNINMIEDIIEWITVFNDKNILQRKISLEYPELEKEKINKIINLKYKGWARLSKKLINGVSIIDSYQNRLTILDILKESSLNFMQIINSKKYDFNKIIEQENKIGDYSKMTYDNLIKDLQGSPKIKRAVWQSIKIIEEIKKIIGCYPKHIFIEFPRHDDVSKRTNTRLKMIENLYKNLKEENDKYINKDTRDNLKKCKSLTKRQLLYFLQLGKSMYSGEDLEYDSLESYETDHIIYQSLIKDDSIDNLVLVKKSENQNRSDQVMPANFVSAEIKRWWEFLKNQGLMSSKKYNNLTKRYLNRYEEQGFINRQLVETGQITKHVTNLLINCYEKYGVEIVSIKAGLVDNFKKQYEIYKNRNVNDYHHAKDAFIVSIVGNYILNRFPKLDQEFIYNEYSKYSSNKKNDEFERRNRFGFIIGSMNYSYDNRNGNIWDSNKSISEIKKQLNYKDVFITKKLCKNKGKFYNDTIYPKLKEGEKCTNPIPLKKDLDVYKYGHYLNENIAYSSVVEYKFKNKRKKSLLGVPVRYSYIIGNSKEKLIDYFQDVVKLEDVRILKDKIYKYQLFKNDKGYFYLASTNEWHNAKQLILDNDAEKVIYSINNNKPVDDEELIKTLNKIIEKLKNHYPIFDNIAKKVITNEKVANLLSNEDKKKLITELLKVTKANGENGNFSVLNNKNIISNLTEQEKKERLKCTDREGRLNSKNMIIDDTIFIYQSVTGMYYEEVKY